MATNIIRSVSFPKEVFKGLDRIAKQQKRPRSRVLADALKRYYRVWLLERQQAVGRKYADKLDITTEKGVERLLQS